MCGRSMERLEAPKGIVPTEADVGRRVRLTVWSGYVLPGKITDHRPCGYCGQPCCFVLYDGERHPVATLTRKLEWADEELL